MENNPSALVGVAFVFLFKNADISLPFQAKRRGLITQGDPQKPVSLPLFHCRGFGRGTAGVRCSCWRACPACPALPLLLLFCCCISSINTKKKSLSARPFPIIWKLASFMLFLKLIVSIIRALQCYMHPQEIITQMYFFLYYTGPFFFFFWEQFSSLFFWDSIQERYNKNSGTNRLLAIICLCLSVQENLFSLISKESNN